MLFQLTWNKGFKCSCFDVFIMSCCRCSAQFAPFVSANQFFPLLKSCWEDLAVCTDLEPRFVAEVLYAFVDSEDPNDGPNVSAPQDLMVLLQERYRSFHFLSRPEVQRGPVHSFPEHRQLVLDTQRPELLIKNFVCDNVVLIFHSSITGRKAEPYAAIRNPVVFLSRSVNLTDSPLNVGGFPRPLTSTRLCRSLDRGFA